MCVLKPRAAASTPCPGLGLVPLRGERIYTFFALRRGTRFVGKKPHFHLIYKNKTTSVTKRPPNVKPHLPHFRVQNEVNEVRFLWGIGVTEVVLFFVNEV